VVGTKGWAVLRHRQFSTFVVARFLTATASQMQGTAVGWQLYEKTHDVRNLGYVGLSLFLPFLVLILPSGHVADRFNRRWIVAGSALVAALSAAALLWISKTEWIGVWPVFSVLVAVGSARAFSMPAGQAILPNLVPPSELGPAVALGSSTFHAATILGPVLGGFLYLHGPDAVYSSVLALDLFAFLFLISTSTRQEPATVGSGSLRKVLDGFRFVRSRPIVFGAISLDLFAVLFGGATALLPAFARDVLHTDSAGLGFLRAAPATGSVIATVLLASFPLRRRIGWWMFGGVALFGAATVGFGLSSSFVHALVFLSLLGAGDMVSVYVRHILVQVETPDAIRGRVSAVNSVFIGASNELGEFESGFTAGIFGLIPAVVAGGVASLVVSLGWAAWFPPLRGLDAFPEGPTPLPEAEVDDLLAEGAAA